MTPADSIEPQVWTRRKWWTLITLIFALHVGLILWLARGVPPRTDLPGRSPTLSFLTGRADDIPGFMDPTLLVLPGPRSFTVPAWADVPVREHHFEEWDAPALTLTNRVDQLGNALNDLIRETLARPHEVAGKPEPARTTVSFAGQRELMLTNSILVIEGELKNRALVSSYKLDSWSSSNLLSNTVVRVLVNDEGRVSSAVGEAESGSPNVDARAVEVARSLRFQSAPRRIPGRTNGEPGRLTKGWLIFRWHMATNAPSADR